MTVRSMRDDNRVQLRYWIGNSADAGEGGTIGRGEEFTFSPPRALFRFGCVEAGAHDYGVMGNGQKIVCIKEPEAETKATQVNVVLNWASELKNK